MRLNYLPWFIFSVAVFFHFSGAFAQLAPNPELKMPCDFFKNGKFEYTSPGRIGISFLRRGRKQIETNVQTGEKAKFKVSWDRDTTCTYILTFKKSNRPTRLRKGWKIKVVMTDTGDDFYDFTANRYGIYEHGSVRKVLTAAEKKQKEKEERRKAEEEARIAKEAAIKDSLRKAGVLVDEDKKEEGKNKNEKAKEGDDQAKGDAKKEGDGEGDEEGGKKPKKEKNSKEKKEKAPKEKKEKAPKEKKEKKEKPPKEKKEKPPKEKKNKDKDEGGDEEDEG